MRKKHAKNSSPVFSQLENNMYELLYSNPHDQIAARFHLDGFSEEEMCEILKELKTLPQTDKVRIQNSYRDIAQDVIKLEDVRVWESEQLYTLKMKKK
jgi:hypothetical protein